MIQRPSALCAVLVAAVSVIVVSCGQPQQSMEGSAMDAEVIIVGAGLSGLSAAIELGRAGVRTLVVDMNSMAGGHAVMAGGVAMVGTPVQERAGIEDSPDLAYDDWMEWTDDGDPVYIHYLRRTK